MPQSLPLLERLLKASALSMPDPLRALWRLATGHHALALADQGVVSAVSFATTVVIARTTTPDELGVYAIVTSLIASTIAVQESLVILPYTIRRHRPVGSQAEYAGSVLGLSSVMAAVTAALLTVAALMLAAASADGEVTAVTWALAGLLPFALLREFGRRFAFARLQLGRALILDIAVAVLQIAGLGWLAWSGTMSAMSACGALTLAYGVTGLAWVYLARKEFAVSWNRLPATLRQSWELGRWLLAGKLTVQVQQYIIYWLSITMLGAATTGIYAACMSVVAFANPLVFGLGNILTPRSVLAWKNGGGSGLRRQAIRDSLTFCALLSPFCLVVLVAGEDIIHLLYPGGAYANQGHTVAVLSLAVMATAMGMPASNALASMERPRAIVVAGAVGMVVSVALVWVLMLEWGLAGAAYGALSGNIVGALARWTAFLGLVPRAGDPAPAIRALEDMTGGPVPGGCTAERQGEGDHAVVYAIEATSGKPLCRAASHVVVKLIKPAAGLDLSQVQEQFAALARLSDALDGRRIDGWRIAAPRPLHLCRDPLALVMSRVDGRDMAASAAGADGPRPQDIEEAARAAMAALQTLWSRGYVHGDLGLQNILFGFDERTLAFIDPGTPESCPVCCARGPFSPAALDLAHFLADLGTDVTDIIGSPAARLRRETFAESALKAVFGSIACAEDRQRLLDELRAATDAHLAAGLAPGRSLRGLWHGFVDRTARRRIDALTDRLASELEAGRGDEAAVITATPAAPRGAHVAVEG